MIHSKRAASRKPCKKQAQDLEHIGGEDEHNDNVSNNHSKSSFTSYLGSNLSSSSSYSRNSHLSQNTAKLMQHTSHRTIHQNHSTPNRNPYRQPQRRVELSARIRTILRNDDSTQKPELKSICSSQSVSSASSGTSSYTCSSLSSHDRAPKFKMQLREHTDLPRSIHFSSSSMEESDPSPNYHANRRRTVLFSSSSEGDNTSAEDNSCQSPQASVFPTSIIKTMLQEYSQSQTLASGTQEAQQLMSSILNHCADLEKSQKEYQDRNQILEVQLSDLAASQNKIDAITSDTRVRSKDPKEKLTLYQPSLADSSPSLELSSDESSHQVFPKSQSKFRNLNLDSDGETFCPSSDSSSASSSTVYCDLEASTTASITDHKEQLSQSDTHSIDSLLPTFFLLSIFARRRYTTTKQKTIPPSTCSTYVSFEILQ